MFTGIITDLGEIIALSATHACIQTTYPTCDLSIGASIACDGCCLTITARHAHAFEVSFSQETLACTNLKYWYVGRRINLEQALRVDQRFGGHMVTGHVDAVAHVNACQVIDTMNCTLTFAFPTELTAFIAPKGSVAMNGVSLTVNACDAHFLSTNLIEHTHKVTNLGLLKLGDAVNLEVDMMARYTVHALKKSVQTYG